MKPQSSYAKLQLDYLFALCHLKLFRERSKFRLETQVQLLYFLSMVLNCQYSKSQNM